MSETNSSKGSITLIILTALLLVLTFCDGLPDGQFIAFLRTMALIATVSVWPLVAVSLLKSKDRRAPRPIRISLVVCCYILIVPAITARIVTSLYVANTLANDHGSFIAYVYSHFGTEEHRSETTREGLTASYDYVQYEDFRPVFHGSRVWTANGNTKIREETMHFDVRHGPFKSYYRESGMLFVSGQYRRDKKDGDWKIFRPNGIELARGEFDMGSPVQSSWTYYDKEGNLESKGAFRGYDETFLTIGASH